MSDTTGTCRGARRVRRIHRPVIAAVLLFSGVVMSSGAAARPADALSASAVPARSLVSSIEIRLKLADGAGAAVAAGNLHESGLAPVQAVLSRAHALRVSPLFTGPDPATLRSAYQRSAGTGAAVADLSQYFRVAVPVGTDTAALSAQLRALPGVQNAYPAPLAASNTLTGPAHPVTAASATAPGTPNFVRLQRYADPAPAGIDARFAAGWPGGTGSRVKVVDLEFSWNTAHEDLAKARVPGAAMPYRTPQDPFADNNHGTAVLGVLAASRNRFGVSGLAPHAGIGFTNAQSVEEGFNPGGAILADAGKIAPGDVLLIELQTQGPNGEGAWVPMEWIPDVYDAIRYAVRVMGINVVEAAGNGGQNLDAPIYGNTFPQGKPDSGAIMVGAGANSTAHCGDPSPHRSRVSFSDYGARLNVQGWGECVATTGYGDLYPEGPSGSGSPNRYYTSYFSGTSSASAVVAGAVADLASAYERLNGRPAQPALIRRILQRTGTPQRFGPGALAGRIGPLPDLARALVKTDLTDPTPPPAFTATAAAGPQVRLRWTAAADNVGVSGYRVLRDGQPLTMTPSAGGSYTDTAVQPGHTYLYAVQAGDRAGRLSAPRPARAVHLR